MSHAPPCGACKLPSLWRNCRRAATGVPGWVGRASVPRTQAQGSGARRRLGTDRGGVAGSVPGVSGGGEAGRSCWHGLLAAHWRLGDHGRNWSPAATESQVQESGRVRGRAPLAHCSVTAAETSAARSVPSTRTMRRVSLNCRGPRRSVPERPTDRQDPQHTVCRVEAAALREVPRCRSGDVDDGAVDELDVEHQPPTEHREHVGGLTMTVGSGVGVGVGVGGRRRRRKGGVGNRVGVGDRRHDDRRRGNRRDGGPVGTTGRAVGCGTRDTVGTLEDKGCSTGSADGPTVGVGAGSVSATVSPAMQGARHRRAFGIRDRLRRLHPIGHHRAEDHRAGTSPPDNPSVIGRLWVRGRCAGCRG